MEDNYASLCYVPCSFCFAFLPPVGKEGKKGRGGGRKGSAHITYPMFICVVVLDNPMMGVHPLPVPAGKLAEANDKDVLFLNENVELVISQGLPGT